MPMSLQKESIKETSYRPYALFTLREGDELDVLIRKTYALADLMNCVYHGEGEGPEPENLAWISGELFSYAQKACEIWQEGMQREREIHEIKYCE